MFTGIIETKGLVFKAEQSHTNLELYIKSDFHQELRIDQSIAHNGVCLTIDQLGVDWYRCTLIEETLNKTTFGTVQPGDSINLERSLTAERRIDGHFVQGHIDSTALCTQALDLHGSWLFSFELASAYRTYVVPKGSVCINGVSLTISDLDDTCMSVSIIPFTFAHTNFNQLKVGQAVNIEFDILGKYIKRIMDIRNQDLLL
jgi:riboflavin synthase